MSRSRWIACRMLKTILFAILILFSNNLTLSIASTNEDGNVSVWVDKCAEGSDVVDTYLLTTPFDAGARIQSIRTDLSRRIVALKLRVPPGHHYFVVKNGGCASFMAAYVFPGRTTHLSASLTRQGGSPGLDAFDNSLGGLLPEIPLGEIYLVRVVDNSASVVHPLIRTGDMYDFEFVRPGSYYVDFRLTDGTLCRMPVRFSTSTHMTLSPSLKEIEECFRTSPQGAA